ncbi:polyprenyl synthetase family protein [Mycobacterium sp. 852014-52450_SCH5900713]|uniref:polyprenyl synthetase family protein n=1 Tax=Mycobacterium sp. 852014-52450_SCH5900713 TaxID=1834116 RepID=UPI001E38CF63|nr:polyprenyl synthetase family protein [Mycobacterium sp. 852014-52450_SCH5900713]
MVPASGAPGGEEWRAGLRTAVLGTVAEFVSARRATDLAGAGLDTVGDILAQFLSNGKCLRSTFMYLGWLCGAPPSGAALTAAASLELLHAFALIQDDVMDRSARRRGRPAAHVQLAQWHREREPASCAEKFGESAAVLLGDICLIWAEQMLRESGIQARRLQRVWPRYDAMRTELAIGQFADLAADLRSFPTLDAVLDVARRKSGNYTVRRPLELGAAMAGCGDRTLARLGRYGGAVGEAFQLRDDVLGVFGSPAATGKPSGGDLLERKATSLIVAAYQLADAPTRRLLVELMNLDELDDAALRRWKRLIAATGAVEMIEQMISRRVASALDDVYGMEINEAVCSALAEMAVACVQRRE